MLLCHAGLPFFAGGYVGVDVFFVISGFLITRLLLGELESTGGISLRRFYARRARRLLPLSAVLLASVGILSLLLLSPVRAVEVSGDIVSSALYTANWHFAAQSVDYFAQDIEPSPVLHLWSLAIEEQFYVVWPSLLLAVTWLWRRRGGSVRPAHLGDAGDRPRRLASLLGVQLTDDQPAAAYFSTFGRAWELASGRRWRCSGRCASAALAAAAIGWAGLAAIVYAAFAFDATTPFPGTAALLPTLGTACLILAGASLYGQAKAGPAGLLSLAPVRYVGRISYSWYMWHWPALIFAAAIWGPSRSPAGLARRRRLLIPTVATHHLIEDPVRLSRALARRPNRALAVGVGCMAIGVCAGVGLSDAQPTLDTAPLADVKGAAALAEQPRPQQRADAVRPNPLRARERPLPRVLRRLPGRHRRHQLEQVPLRRPRRQAHADPLRRLPRDAVLPGARRAGRKRTTGA